MRQAETQEEREEMRRIFGDPQAASRAVSHTLYVDDEPIVASALRAYSDSEAPAVVLEATLPWPISPLAIGREARVVLRIGDVRRWVDYIGEVVDVTENPDGTGSLAASTAGFYQGGDASVKFNGKDPQEYVGWPSEALEDMLTRFPYNRIRIPEIRNPRFVKQGETAYPIVADVGSAIADVENEARIKQKDTFLNEAVVRRQPTVGDITADRSGPPWRVGREVSEFSADPKGESRFYAVAVVYQNPVTGEYVRATDEDAVIRYERRHMAPPRDVIFYEELVPEVDPVTGVGTGEFLDDALSLQSQIAITMGLGGEHSVSVSTPYIDPRIEDWDGRDIIKVDHQTRITTRWRMTIDAQERNYTENRATYTASAVALFRRPLGEGEISTYPGSGRVRESA